jgi:hypothetical protein
VLGVAGLQRRLLSQPQDFDRRRWPTMIMLELEGQLERRTLTLARRVDHAHSTAGRHRQFPGSAACPDRHQEAQRTAPQRVAEMVLQGGVVDGMREG